MLGRLDAGALTLSEVCRFPNEPIRQNGSLQWDIRRLWHEIRGGLSLSAGTPLESIGVDTWGCDYALIDELRDAASKIRITTATRAPTGRWRRSWRRVPRGADLRDHRHPVPAVQHAVSALRGCQRDAAADRRRRRLWHDPRPAELLADRRAARRVHRWRRRRSSSTRARGRGRRTCCRDLDMPTRLLPPLVEPGTILGRLERDVSARARRHAGGRPGLPRYRFGGGGGVAAAGRAFISSGTWSLLGTELPAPVMTPQRARSELHQRGGRLRHDAAAEEHRRPVAAAGVPAHAGPRRAGTRLR